MEQIDYTQISDLVSNQINDSFGGVFQYIAIGSLVVTLLILAIWIFNTVRKWMVEKAIFEIRDELHEMNKRQGGTIPEPAPEPDKKD